MIFSKQLPPTPEREVPAGAAILHDPAMNKGMAFTEEERDALGLRGLLPPSVQDQDVQVMRVLGNLRRKESDLERYIFLAALQDRNETLFYRVVTEHLDEMMPLIYTPTVGQACEQYGHIFRRPRGLFISSKDRGRVKEVLQNWPHSDVRIIVVTDGERILGLGDLGADGMAIPVGKLALYTACAGIHPAQCLPVTLDVGTENEKLLGDPLYIGLRQKRLRDAPYDELIHEFLSAANEVFPQAMIQLEDFANQNAFNLLRKYQDKFCLFDDDIQGSVVLAGVHSALRATKQELVDQRFLFLGAGEAAIGIATLLVGAMVAAGLGEEEARRRCWFVDSKGLVVRNRSNLAEHKRPYAHDGDFTTDGLAAVRSVRPTVLVGASGTPGLFTQPILRLMAALNKRPIIFALSNPTSKSECTALQAYAWTDGRALFASGSPFPPVDVGGKMYVSGQANNAYIFPGVGLGVVITESERVTDRMFYAAAKALADEVSEADCDLGRIYPSLKRIRNVSLQIAIAVAGAAYEDGVARRPEPDDLSQTIRAYMFDPVYPSYV